MSDRHKHGSAIGWGILVGAILGIVLSGVAHRVDLSRPSILVMTSEMVRLLG